MIRILTVGKTKESYLRQGINDFLERISHFHKIEYVELKDKENLKEEAKDILGRIKDEFVVVLDEKGKECSSRIFAEFLKKKCLEEGRNVLFIIGSAEGLHEDVKERADLLLSMSQMTFTHEMCRLFLSEQIYRAFNIIKGTQYHR